MNPNQQSPNKPGQFPNQPVPPQPGIQPQVPPQPPNQPGQFPGGVPPNQFPNQPVPPQSGIQPQVPPQPPIGQPPLGVPPATQPSSGSQMPNYGRSPAGNGSKKGIIIGIVIGAVVLLAGLIVVLFLVFGGGDENTESSEMPADSEQEAQNGDGDAEDDEEDEEEEDEEEDEEEEDDDDDDDTSDIVSKMNRIASAADMECELLEDEERRESIGEFDSTTGLGNEEFYDLVIESFKDSTFFECERGDWDYDAWYPAERYLSVLQAAFDDPIKYGFLTEDALQTFRDNAETFREQCMDDSKRTELNEKYTASASERFLTVDGFIFTIPHLPDHEDFKDVMRENGFEAEALEIDSDFCDYIIEEIIDGY